MKYRIDTVIRTNYPITSCHNCPLVQLDIYDGVYPLDCVFVQEISRKDRPSKCPLVEVDE